MSIIEISFRQTILIFSVFRTVMITFFCIQITTALVNYEIQCWHFSFFFTCMSSNVKINQLFLQQNCK